MKIIYNYFNKYEIRWENLARFCTDGVCYFLLGSDILGSYWCLVTTVKKQDSSTAVIVKR